jgi:hypothetical protein
MRISYVESVESKPHERLLERINEFALRNELWVEDEAELNQYLPRYSGYGACGAPYE